MTECNVCCDKITKRNIITCHFCDYVTCKPCTKRFILDGTIAPVCMNCKKPWNRETLTNNFGKTFIVKEYKEKRENNLFETEKALMPETQEIATRQKRIKDINKEIYTLQVRLRELKSQKKLLQEEGGAPAASETKKTSIAKLMIKCPVKECRGFASSIGYACGVCDTKICKECHEPVNEDGHTCDKNTLETVKLLKKDTKHCPKCQVGIHKIEGCDQMYCTQCHTAFSWCTGEIVIGERIHNPHYYEYLRRTGTTPGREIGDIPCGGLPNQWMMRNFHKDRYIMNAHRIFVHIDGIELRNYRTNRIENNRDLRIKYINNEITEEQFKRTLQKREKDVEKKREILQVLNTCIVVGSDILRRLLSHNDSETATKEIQELVTFTNESMVKISKLFNCVVPVIEEFRILTRKY